MDPKAAIAQAAREAGVDPAYALAVAERENDKFDTRARASKTIKGLYQMSGELRHKYGVGESDDALDQARGWVRSLPDIRTAMKSRLGRDPTDQETYLGHHYGPGRAARTLNMDPSTPTEAIFTPQEMRLNPHFARAGTIGNLNSSVMGDIDKRMARFGGAASSPSSAEPATLYKEAGQPADLSSFGEAVDVSPMLAARETTASAAGSVPDASRAADLSSFGDVTQTAQAPQPANLSAFGTAV